MGEAYHVHDALMARFDGRMAGVWLGSIQLKSLHGLMDFVGGLRI